MQNGLDLKNQSAYSEQEGYINILKDMVLNYYGYKPSAMVVTYGCQQNVSDSEKLKGMLQQIGFSFTDDDSAADFIIFNTCAVREHAEDRVFGNIGALKNKKRKNPKLIIAMCGCMAQQQKVKDRIYKSFPFVNILFGTHVIYKLPEFIYKYLTLNKRIFDIDENTPDIVEEVPLKRDGTFKGWLPIMYGCNNFCTYCIVPYVRGRERSRSVENIVKDAKALIADGCKDITLLGQNVNSYKYEDTDFPALLRIINSIPGNFRIRFMTSHPKDCSDELLSAIKECDKVCKHLHLPFQSGSNEILKRMNRKYTKEHYLGLIKKAKELIKDITFTTDIIVGFPGETYKDFLETVDVVKKVEFLSLFTFIFSKRDGTPAAKMEDNIPLEEKSKWFSELLKVQSEIAAQTKLTYNNKEFVVLCDEPGRKPGFMVGHTDGNISFEFKGTNDLLGKFIKIKTYLNNGEVCADILKIID